MTIQLDKQGKEHLLAKYSTFLFDCDGVIWIGNEMLPGVKQTLELLQSLNKKLLFVSNNSTKSRLDYVDKLGKMGVGHISVDQIINSAYSTAIYVKDFVTMPLGKNKIWVLGQSGIVDELNAMGFNTVTWEDLQEEFTPQELTMENIHTLIKSDVGCVVVGLDFQLTYLKIAITMQYLLNKDITFIATNMDSTFPFNKTKLPGAGSVVDVVSFASGRRPDAVCGKPHRGMMASIESHHQLDKDQCLMVGDRLNTDMRFGHVNGMDTLLVLSGIEDASAVPNEDVTYYCEGLGDLSVF